MYRIMPHSTADNDLLYRTKEEVEEHRAKDGVVKLRNYLIDQGLWDEQRESALLEELDREIREATVYAEKAPYPKPEDALLHVYGEEL